MVKASHGCIEYVGNRDINLSDIVSIWAYNNGEAIAIIDGFPIYPKQKSILVLSDNCVSDIQMRLTFKEIAVVNSNKPTANQTLEVYIPEINPEPVTPKIKQSIIFYIKKLVK